MKIRLLSALVLCVAAPMAMAAGNTATANLTINATVLDSCVVQNQTITFAGFDPVNNTGNAAQSNISVTCSNGTAYTIGLDYGANASGSQRNMKSGINLLQYNLYQDNNPTPTPWDDVSNVVSGTGSGTAASYTVYAAIPTQAAVAGTGYQDVVSINVHY